MLLMVTSRRFRSGAYLDEEQPDFKYDYLHEYNNKPRTKDAFEKKGRAGFERSLLFELKRLKTDENINTPKIGIYLHGYNNNWQESIDEIYDLEKALEKENGYKPVIVGFSWPSSGKTKDYLSDREEVRDSVPAFVRLLRDIDDFLRRNERECFSTSYCIAHSMGNYLLRKGMEYLSDHLGGPAGRMMFNETVMLAPDVAAKDIERHGKGQYIANFSRRVHIYYSKFDRALKASSVKRFGQNRLGRHGAEDYDNLPPNVVVVDAKKYANPEATDGLRDREKEPVSVHSSYRYHPSIIADIVQVLSSVDRSLMAKRRLVGEGEPVAERRLNHFELT